MPNLSWSNIQLGIDNITVFIPQSKTDPFRQGHTVTIHATGMSTCPIQALNHYTKEVPLPQRCGPLFNAGRFSPLSRQQLTTLRRLLQNTEHNQQHYASHSFRSGAATTAAAAGLPTWLIKTLGRWRSDAYQLYIHSSPAMLQSVPSLLARVKISNGPAWDPNTTRE